jgi:predicted transcriptional regulator of viral defense system
MSVYTKLKKLNNTPHNFLTTKDLRDILEIGNRRTFENTIKRLQEEKILTKIEKGKYVKTNSNYTKFDISQFIYSPSYISLETALNYHGLIEQFPFEITAITTKKSVEKEFEEQIYSYVNVRKELFWGFEKEGNFLMAMPEKAIFDQIYTSIVGGKSENILKNIKKDRFQMSKVLEYTKLLEGKTKKAVLNKLREIF